MIPKNSCNYKCNNYVLEKSTWTEWSMTKSAGHTGFILSEFPPSVLTASLIAARSTTAGTPVKS